MLGISRCGTRCENCRVKNEGRCPGCVEQAHPFWGRCPVKGCCEARGHRHCGQCPDFICKLLADFAYDEVNGDGTSARLDACVACARAERNEKSPL